MFTPVQFLPPAGAAAGALTLQPQPLPVAPADQPFAALVRIAAQLFGMPIGFVALFDGERCGLAAAVGLELAQAADDARRCADLLLRGSEPVAIDDLLQHRQIAAESLLQHQPGLRSVAAAPIVDAGGRLLGAVGVFDQRPRSFQPVQLELLRDLALLATTLLLARQRGELLQQFEAADPLTGVSGAQVFAQALDVELRHSMRTGEPFAVLRLDLDGFADINTAYGEAAGDAVLREVGRRLRQQVRLGDLLARVGADEFAIVMRHGGAEQARMLEARIVAALRQPIAVGCGGDELGAGISIGIAAYSDEICSVSELLREADRSLQQARAQKESRWQVFGKLFAGSGLRLVEEG